MDGPLFLYLNSVYDYLASSLRVTYDNFLYARWVESPPLSRVVSSSCMLKKLFEVFYETFLWLF